MAFLAWKNGDISLTELKHLLSQREQATHKQAQQEVIERVRSEVIGEDERIPTRYGKTLAVASGTPESFMKHYRNKLRAEQRQALAEIEKELL
jgi:hypothetical protein